MPWRRPTSPISFSRFRFGASDGARAIGANDDEAAAAAAVEQRDLRGRRRQHPRSNAALTTPTEIILSE